MNFVLHSGKHCKSGVGLIPIKSERCLPFFLLAFLSFLFLEPAYRPLVGLLQDNNHRLWWLLVHKKDYALLLCTTFRGGLWCWMLNKQVKEMPRKVTYKHVSMSEVNTNCRQSTSSNQLYSNLVSYSNWLPSILTCPPTAFLNVIVHAWSLCVFHLGMDRQTAQSE